MRIIGNLLWWLFGGLEAAIGYFTGSLALACTIIGIPFALQTFKIGLLCLWPFGSTLRDTDCPTGCIRQSRPILKVCNAKGLPMMVHARARLPVK